MLNKIADILKKNNIEVWRMTEVKSKTAELYFIKKKLDIPRFKELTQYIVTVFNDFEEGDKKFRGESTALISPGMSEREIEDHVISAYKAAGFVKNPWFELADPQKSQDVKPDSDLVSMDIKESAAAFAKAMFSVDTEEDAFINSAEIFASRHLEHIVGSNGLDVAFESDYISGEMISQCVTPIDVEQYREFSYDSFNVEGIKTKVLEAIEDVRARANASTAPKAGVYDIILTGENLETLFELYGARSSASMIVPGYSQWKIGDAVQGEDIVGEKLNLFVESTSPYSSEGVPLPARQLIKDGNLDLITGNTRFCRYLGIEPVGDYEKVRCENGLADLCEMKKPGVLELVSFSDFQMDPMDGHFKGEIRLAHLYKEDGSVQHLTGGSVNGNLLELQKNLIFSKEQYEDMNYKGPYALLLKGVAVAGI